MSPKCNKENEKKNVVPSHLTLPLNSDSKARGLCNEVILPN